MNNLELGIQPIESQTEIGKIPFDTAEPPLEVIQVMQEQGLSEDKIEGWVAVPTIIPTPERVSRKEIETQGEVDALKLLESFLDEPSLEGTLRTLDLLNGCGHHCDTCLADSALPSRMFTAESLERLFNDGRFLTMLQPDSLRIGSSGDILDHPQASSIVRMMLEKTSPLDERRMSREGKHHQIKIFTNYRPNREQQLDELIQIAQENSERFRLTISLPFNRRDTINKRFVKYAGERKELLGEHDVDEDGNFKFRWLFEEGDSVLENVGIQDVRHPRLLFMIGRVLSEEANAGRVPEWDQIEGDRDISFRYRGLSKTYLNADALWLKVYATPYESHTGRVFTPLTTENLKVLSYIPYHPDFPTPPNWPGGSGVEKESTEARRIKGKYSSVKPMKNLVVVE